ncbi:SSI family serine proteinase inhibitor [Marinactinospora thermotolerans]|uniref:Subtilisin inhibitor-like n=1 Tax=Marinactinospora thermotolerans DSM 45154 TaxID=1122192 RepID=A0A1T4TG65_9ACTN|nr:SSI family serine proteinase inhibitor [Marinactinospora thermotolerans]SKA39475.1 Subtilisin inhibitor-like [Marinactinospora thermotolerans DSM 45154]
MRQRHLLATALAAAACLTVPAPAHAGSGSSSWLELSISHEHHDGVRTVILKCDPPGGTHPSPEEACASLEAVDGVFEALPAAGLVCTMQYDPVVVRAFGHWEDVKVHYEEEFPNPCVAADQTDGVFWF